MKDLYNSARFQTQLGIERREDGTVVLDTKPWHQVGPDLIHFAVVTSVAEAAAAVSVGMASVPVSVSVTLLGSVKPGQLIGKGRLIRGGRKLAVAEGEIYQGQNLVAKALITFAVTPPPPSPAKPVRRA